LLKRPAVLIFDEATSNLDVETSEHFARTINQLKGSTTILFITTMSRGAWPWTRSCGSAIRAGRSPKPARRRRGSSRLLPGRLPRAMPSPGGSLNRTTPRRRSARARASQS